MWALIRSRPFQPSAPRGPEGVLDRQRGGKDLLPVISRRPGRQHRPQLLERAPQPADPPVHLALMGQPHEQAAPSPALPRPRTRFR